MEDPKRGKAPAYETWPQRKEQKKMLCSRREATLWATRLLCEKEGESSKARKEKANMQQNALDTPPAANEAGKAESDWRKKKAIEVDILVLNQWKVLYDQKYNIPDAMEQLELEEKQGQDEERERESQKVPEDDWVVVADDFGILVFKDDGPDELKI
ncbi:hypothetical protein TrVFT333_008087 [Trichoderma virens FT-333]|nr:hypothetical protein TrVFT333_008087 [Trichoderma virens FT-333]